MVHRSRIATASRTAAVVDRGEAGQTILDHPLLSEAGEQQLLYDWNEVAPHS